MLRRVIIGDKTWIFEYEPEAKHQTVVEAEESKTVKVKSQNPVNPVLRWPNRLGLLLCKGA